MCTWGCYNALPSFPIERPQAYSQLVDPENKITGDASWLVEARVAFMLTMHPMSI